MNIKFISVVGTEKNNHLQEQALTLINHSKKASMKFSADFKSMQKLENANGTETQ